jgi:hypothetical protein
LALYVELVWNPDREFGLSRRDRPPGRFLAYVPDEFGEVCPKWGRRHGRPRRMHWRRLPARRDAGATG